MDRATLPRAKSPISWNSMGATPTPTLTLGIRLSCNFVNGYTTVYRVQYTFTRVLARIPNGHHLARDKSADKSARIVVRVRLVAS